MTYNAIRDRLLMEFVCDYDSDLDEETWKGFVEILKGDDFDLYGKTDWISGLFPPVVEVTSIESPQSTLTFNVILIRMVSLSFLFSYSWSPLIFILLRMVSSHLPIVSGILLYLFYLLSYTDISDSFCDYSMF